MYQIYSYLLQEIVDKLKVLASISDKYSSEPTRLMILVEVNK